MYDIDEYKEVHTLDEAKMYLNKNPSARIIAGGTDILIRLRNGKISRAHLMGISRIEELKQVRKDESGDIHIGPLMTFTLLEENQLILENIPPLAEAVSSVGGPQIRNVATIGGNICNGATSADSASVLLCLNAQLVLESHSRKRVIPIVEFYLGPGKVVLEEGEILSDIVIKETDYKNYTGIFKKFSQRQAMDIATLGCAVLLKIDNNRFSDIRIAFGVASPTPVRCKGAEKAGIGLEVTQKNINIISKAVLDDIKPRDSWRGSKAFRLHLAEVLTSRSLSQLTGLKG